MNKQLAKQWVLVGDTLDVIHPLDLNSCTEMVSNLSELFLDLEDPSVIQACVNHILTMAKGGLGIYLGKTQLDRTATKILTEVLVRKPGLIYDEQLELVKRMAFHGSISTGQEFFDRVLEATPNEDKVVFVDVDRDYVTFHAPKRKAQMHRIEWAEDDVSVDGMVIRHTAVMATGTLLSEMLGVMSPTQVIGFIAERLAVNGVEELLGYGRAFGPGQDDHTNATLTVEAREFRSQAVVGVVSANLKHVTKAKPDVVVETANVLADQGVMVFLHQQCMEIYRGTPALKAFRGQVKGVGRKALITLPAKSTKHSRVDVGAYGLYTRDGSGTVTLPALIGQFEESNDGSIYAPAHVMAKLEGYLKERVSLVKDFDQMSPDLVSKYYMAEMQVVEGDRIVPGQTVFEVDGIPFTWDSKADYGIVTQTVFEAESDLVRIEVLVNAWFTGEAKLRGPGKGLIASAELAGVTSSHGDHLLIGAAGIIKDSAAFAHYSFNVKKTGGWVVSQMCQTNYDLAKAKHQPVLDQGVWVKHYGDVRMIFDDTDLTVSTNDPNAFTCNLTFVIEASPVAQSVGKASLTLPQMAWLSAGPAGNRWLKSVATKGVNRRIDTLSYLHAVSNNVLMSDSN